MLNEIPHLRIKKLAQTAVYLPHFVSWVIFAGIVIQLLSPSHGIVNQVVKLFRSEPIFFLAKPAYFRPIVVFTAIWKGAGWGSIIFLAAISTVDPELYESAYMDGATRLQRIWHITIPCISATIVVMLLIRLGRILTVGFEQVYVLQNPAVYETGDIIETYVFRVGIGMGQFSLTTAVGMFKSVIGLILIYISNTAARKLFGRNIW
jgi:putative aldouronate transport system permease protein